MISKTTMEVIQEAYKKGYHVNDKGDVISPKGNVLKCKMTNNNRVKYLTFGVRFCGKVKYIHVHRLVAYQKYGDITFSCDCVRHLDGNSLNNSFDNIEIGTMSDNSHDIPKEKRVKIAKYASSFQRNYNNDIRVVEIKKYYKEVNSYSKTMERFGILSRGTLHYILNKR